MKNTERVVDTVRNHWKTRSIHKSREVETVMAIPVAKHTKTVAVLPRGQIRVLAHLLPMTTMVTCCSKRFTRRYDEVKIFDIDTLYRLPLDALAVLMWYKDIDQLILPSFANLDHRYRLGITNSEQSLTEMGGRWEPKRTNADVVLYTKR